MTKKKRDYAKTKHVGVSDILNLAVKGTMSAGAHALSTPVGRFLRGVFLRRFV